MLGGQQAGKGFWKGERGAENVREKESSPCFRRWGEGGGEAGLSPPTRMSPSQGPTCTQVG